MSDYIKRADALAIVRKRFKKYTTPCVAAVTELQELPTADVVEVDKVQNEIDYWHDKAQSYEQTILKLALNKADVVEVVRCKDCRFYTFKPQQTSRTTSVRRCNRSAIVCTKPDDYCSFGERGTHEKDN